MIPTVSFLYSVIVLCITCTPVYQVLAAEIPLDADGSYPLGLSPKIYKLGDSILSKPSRLLSVYEITADPNVRYATEVAHKVYNLTCSAVLDTDVITVIELGSGIVGFSERKGVWKSNSCTSSWIFLKLCCSESW